MFGAAALRHTARPPDAHIIGRDAVRVRLRTARDARLRAFVEWGDRQDWAGPDRARALRWLAADEHFEYWEADLSTFEGRARYLFRLEEQDASDAARTRWFSEDGLTAARPSAEWPDSHFHCPYIHSTQVPTPPAWLREAICYEIFPDRFARDDATAPPDPRWPGYPTHQAHWGGSLRGIIARLPHIASLGVNLLWLTPIFASPTNHKYDTSDYGQIDPQFGDDETLARLIAASHRRAIRVVLDGVFNHAGTRFAPWQDVVERGTASPYWGWFEVTGERPDPGRRNYRTFGHNPAMPRLVTANPEVQAYLIEQALRWTRMGIDGWRLDCANEVDATFWRSFRRQMRAANPNLYLVGEIAHDAAPWLAGDQFDGVMHYPLRGALLRWLAAGQTDAEGRPAPGAPATAEALTARGFVDRLGTLRAWYPEWARVGSLNPLGTHDVPRLLSALGGDRRRWRLALAFMLAYEGIPLLYYGDEVGMSGGHDPDCRRPMVWAPERQDAEMLAWTRELVALRQRTPALRESGVWPLHADDAGLMALLRGPAATPAEDPASTGSDPPDGTHPALLVLNAGAGGLRTLTLDLADDARARRRGQPAWPPDAAAQDALTGERWVLQRGRLTIPMGPLDARILVPCPPPA